MPIEVYGDGHQVSDMVWVGDLALNLVEALEVAEQGDIDGTVFECGLGERNTVLRTASLVRDLAADLTGNPPVEIVNLPMRPGEVEGDVVTANPLAIEEHPMMTAPSVALQYGLEATLEFYHRAVGGK